MKYEASGGSGNNRLSVTKGRVECTQSNKHVFTKCHKPGQLLASSKWWLPRAVRVACKCL